MPSANRTPFRGWLQGAFGEEPVPPAGASVESDAPRPPTARASLVGLTTSAAPPHIPDMVRIAISQAAFDARSLLALLMILLAAPACAGSRFGGGFHGGGFHGGSGFSRRWFSRRRFSRFPPQRRSSPRFLWRLRLRLQLRLGFRQRGVRLWLWWRLWLWQRLWQRLWRPWGKCQKQQRLNRRLCPRSRRRRHSAHGHSN